MNDYDWRADSHACYEDWLAWNRFLKSKGVDRKPPPDQRRQLIEEFLHEVRK